MSLPPEIPTARIPTPPTSSEPPSRLARLTAALAWCTARDVQPEEVRTPPGSPVRICVSLGDLLRVRGDLPLEVKATNNAYGRHAFVDLHVDGLHLSAITNEEPWVSGQVPALGARVTSWSRIGEAVEHVERFAQAVEMQAGQIRTWAIQARDRFDHTTRRSGAEALASVDALTDLQQLVDRVTDAYADAATVITDELGLWVGSSHEPTFNGVPAPLVETTDDVLTPDDEVVRPGVQP